MTIYLCISIIIGLCTAELFRTVGGFGEVNLAIIAIFTMIIWPLFLIIIAIFWVLRSLYANV